MTPSFPTPTPDSSLEAALRGAAPRPEHTFTEALEVRLLSERRRIHHAQHAAPSPRESFLRRFKMFFMSMPVIATLLIGLLFLQPYLSPFSAENFLQKAYAAELAREVASGGMVRYMRYRDVPGKDYLITPFDSEDFDDGLELSEEDIASIEAQQLELEQSTKEWEVWTNDDWELTRMYDNGALWDAWLYPMPEGGDGWEEVERMHRYALVIGGSEVDFEVCVEKDVDPSSESIDVSGDAEFNTFEEYWTIKEELHSVHAKERIEAMRTLLARGDAAYLGSLKEDGHTFHQFRIREYTMESRDEEPPHLVKDHLFDVVDFDAADYTMKRRSSYKVVSGKAYEQTVREYLEDRFIDDDPGVIFDPERSELVNLWTLVEDNPVELRSRLEREQQVCYGESRGDHGSLYYLYLRHDGSGDPREGSLGTPEAGSL